MIDPLDAQKAGLHDAALEQGHEEIALNLDDFPSTGSGQAERREEGAEALRALPPPTPSEAAFEAALRAFDAATARPPDEPARSTAAVDEQRDAFVERVFAKSDEYLRDPYSTIADAPRFHTKIAGVSFEGRQDTSPACAPARRSSCAASPTIPTIANAIAVHYGNLQLGFFNKRLAAHIAPLIDAGARYRARVASLTGGSTGSGPDESIAASTSSSSATAARALARARAGARRSERGDRADDDAERVRRALIGTSQPHEAQRAVLERVDAGKNTLAVLGTGRGKSFCFQFSAAMRAFGGARQDAGRLSAARAGQRSVRGAAAHARSARPAHLSRQRFDRQRGTRGALRGAARGRVGRRAGDAGVSRVSSRRVARARARRRSSWSTKRITSTSRATARPTRGSRRRSRALGDPQVLALTATAGDETFRRIVDELRIDAWVIDPTVRENLHVVDARGTRDKIGYLARALRRRGERARRESSTATRARRSTKVARRLRRELGNEVMFYHAEDAQRRPARGRAALSRRAAARRWSQRRRSARASICPTCATSCSTISTSTSASSTSRRGAPAATARPRSIHLLYGQKRPRAQRVSDRPRRAAACRCCAKSIAA